MTSTCSMLTTPSQLQTIFLLYLVIEDHDTLFIMAEAVHLAGIGVLAYKLLRKKNCGGETGSMLIFVLYIPVYGY